MTPLFKAIKEHLDNFEIGLAMRLDDLGARLDAIDNSLAALETLLGERLALDPQFVAERLGLTPAQSRVAVALAEGKTVEAIATESGRKKSSVRWNLRQINRKLDISTQAQLVRLVLTNGVACGDEAHRVRHAGQQRGCGS